MTDLELLYAKLCVNNSMAAEEILWLQSQDPPRARCADSKDLLSILMVLLRKYFSTLTDHPHLFFQAVLNDGGPVLSPMASNILQNKYPEIPYMEFVNKQKRQGAVLASFQCSSSVICFDVSPELDYMVCECYDGTIHLWSLRTGKQLWKRSVMVKKLPHVIFRTWRISPSSSHVLSFYRSLVFHPTEAVVLPGVLSQAYDFNGDLKPLFPESNCSFTVCSISGDKTTMLTDCPHNAKCIILWSLRTGSEINRNTRDEDVLSFAWSRDGKLLAISHLSGCIAIVDAVDGFRTLGKTYFQRVCGMIKFSPDSRSLLCHSSTGFKNSSCTFRLICNVAGHASCRLDVLEEPYVNWQLESRSEGGFLLGDPLSCAFDGIVLCLSYDFVLDKHTVLRMRADCVQMWNIDEQQENENKPAHTIVKQIVFSLSGENIYVVSSHDDLYATTKTTVTAWNVSSSERVSNKKVDVLCCRNCLSAVKGGVLVIRGTGILQMWNFELSKCVQDWTNICIVKDVIPICEERVACAAGEKVIILDTTNEEILSTIQIGPYTHLLACNSKFQILTWSEDELLCLSDRKTTLWEKQLYTCKFGKFSPAETFVIISFHFWATRGICVLDVVSGKTLHVLSTSVNVSLCEFVTDEECVFISWLPSEQCRVQLFNVKSGDLLSNLPLSDLQLGSTTCLAASPCKRLVAILRRGHEFELIQVQLPRDEDSRKSKWYAINDNKSPNNMG